MAARNDALKNSLSRTKEINLSLTGRKSGRTITIPVWFVLEADDLFLLPVEGSSTQWYKNVLSNASMRVSAGDVEAQLQAAPITDAKRVASVVEKFRNKYGAGDIKKYYSTLDVAVLVHLP